MSLDEYIGDIDSSEGLGNGAESASEKVSEAFKESVRKAQAGIGRTKKDEKKAKKYDILLAHFLVKIIVDPSYDTLLPYIFTVLDQKGSSNFVVGVLSIIHTGISKEIRSITGKENIVFSYKSDEQISFDDAHLPKEVKYRINTWIEDIIDAATIENSQIQTLKNKELVHQHKESIIVLCSEVFGFFLERINIKIKKSQSISIADFIIGEITQALDKLEITDV